MDYPMEELSEKIATQIKDVLNQIADLPMGYIVKKKIKGKEYYYRRVKIGYECTETYVSGDSVDTVCEQIIKRRELEKRLKELEKVQPLHTGEFTSDAKNFVTDIVIGQELSDLVSHSALFKKRDAAERVREYLQSDCVGKVFLICGMSGAGNTTIMLQTIAEMDEESFGRSAYLRIRTGDDFVRLNHDMKLLRRLGFRYVFVDNATIMDNFVPGAAVFSELFGGYGLKLVITGSESLRLLRAENDELWRACISVYTSFVSFRESKRVLRISGIDEYICHGGTMSKTAGKVGTGLIPYEKKEAEMYVYKAVSYNLEAAVFNRKPDIFPYCLDELRKENQLRDAVYCVVEDMCRSFVIRVLEDMLKSSDGMSDKVSKILSELKSFHSPVSDKASSEIKRWLDSMEFIQYFKCVDLSDPAKKAFHIIMTQPWLRYSFAAALLEDAAFVCAVPCVTETLECVRAAVMKEIVLLETARARSEKSVSVLQSDDIGVDMVVKYDDVGSCGIYRIIYGNEICPDGFVLSDDARKKIESVFGNISERYIIYRGETADQDGVHCVNVEEYLESL